MSDRRSRKPGDGEVFASRGTGGTEAAGDKSSTRGRRSDRRRSSRRHARKRQRELERAAKRQREEERAAVRAAAAAAVESADESLEIELEATTPVAREPEVPLTRSEIRAQRKRKKRSESLSTVGRGLVVLALLVGAAGVGAGLRLLTRDGDGLPTESGLVELAPGVDRQPAMLFVTADEPGPAAAESAIILAYDRVERVATILFVPVSTVADIPGHGVLPLARANEFGGPALAVATTDNLLGVSLDGVAGMSYRSWATLLGRAGDLEVEVPDRIVATAEDGGTQVQFLAGVQRLDGPRAAEYLAARVPGQPELSALPRIQGLLTAWLEALGSDPNLLAEAMSDGLPMVDTGMSRTELVSLISEVAYAAVDDRLDFRVLPVRPIGSGAEDGYRPDEARMAELVADRLAASVPNVNREGRSLQVLNGNGEPGIGQDVAARLLPAGFRVILTGNADNFDHEKTRIVVYDDSPEQLRIAAEIRDLLGVGVVEISLTPQSVVDVTIVVGRDFPAS